jgi:hypothetical protein
MSQVGVRADGLGVSCGVRELEGGARRGKETRWYEPGRGERA